MLRGWNKYDLDPLGGSRVAHNSLDYRYGIFEAFYDAGAIWDPGQDIVARHSGGRGAPQIARSRWRWHSRSRAAVRHRSLWSA